MKMWQRFVNLDRLTFAYNNDLMNVFNFEYESLFVFGHILTYVTIYFDGKNFCHLDFFIFHNSRLVLFSPVTYNIVSAD